MNIAETLCSILLNLGAICLIVTIIFTPLLLIVVRRHYDPLFGKIGGTKGEVGIPLWSPYMRSLGYAFYIVFKHQTVRKPYAYKLYNGYDFRGNATWLAKFVSFSMIYGAIGAFFFCILSTAIGYIFHIPTPG